MICPKSEQYGVDTQEHGGWRSTAHTLVRRTCCCSFISPRFSRGYIALPLVTLLNVNGHAALLLHINEYAIYVSFLRRMNNIKGRVVALWHFE